MGRKKCHSEFFVSSYYTAS